MAQAQQIINTSSNSMLEQHLPNLIKQYPDIDEDSNVSYWAVRCNETEQFKEFFGEPCHYKMRSAGAGWDELITATAQNDEASIRYQKMLINGPFKSMSDTITLGQVDKDYYVHVQDLAKWPANLLYNYCIATRVPLEHSELLPQFIKLTDSGYDDTLAFLLSYSRNGKANGKRGFDNNGHFWFDNTADWELILKGEPTKLSNPYKTNPQECIPTNVIWGNKKPVFMVDWENEKVAEHFGLAVEKIKPPKKKKAPVKKVQINFEGPIPAANMLVQQANRLPVQEFFWAPQPAAAPDPVPINDPDDDDDFEDFMLNFNHDDDGED